MTESSKMFSIYFGDMLFGIGLKLEADKNKRIEELEAINKELEMVKQKLESQVPCENGDTVEKSRVKQDLLDCSFQGLDLKEKSKAQASPEPKPAEQVVSEQVAQKQPEQAAPKPIQSTPVANTMNEPNQPPANPEFDGRSDITIFYRKEIENPALFKTIPEMSLVTDIVYNRTIARAELTRIKAFGWSKDTPGVKDRWNEAGSKLRLAYDLEFQLWMLIDDRMRKDSAEYKGKYDFDAEHVGPDLVKRYLQEYDGFAVKAMGRGLDTIMILTK